MSKLNVDKKEWKCILAETTINKHGKEKLPRRWVNQITRELKKIPGFCCCVSYDNRNMPKKEKVTFNFSFKCTIEGCRIKGKGCFKNDFGLEVKLSTNEVNHEKRVKGSFKSRRCSYDERKKLATRLNNVSHPDKVWHELLREIPKDQYKAGNLEELPTNKKNIERYKI